MWDVLNEIAMQKKWEQCITKLLLLMYQQNENQTQKSFSEWGIEPGTSVIPVRSLLPLSYFI